MRRRSGRARRLVEPAGSRREDLWRGPHRPRRPWPRLWRSFRLCTTLRGAPLAPRAEAIRAMSRLVFCREPDQRCEQAAGGGLRAETEGEALFVAPSRGREATDASIYRIMLVGGLVPKSERDVATALDIARDLEVLVLPAARHQSMRPDHWRRAGHRQQQVFPPHRARPTSIAAPSWSKLGVVRDQLNAELKGMASGIRSRTRPAPRRPSAAWPATSCGSRSIAYGTWCGRGGHQRLAV